MIWDNITRHCRKMCGHIGIFERVPERQQSNPGIFHLATTTTSYCWRCHTTTRLHYCHAPHFHPIPFLFCHWVKFNCQAAFALVRPTSFSELHNCHSMNSPIMRNFNNGISHPLSIWSDVTLSSPNMGCFCVAPSSRCPPLPSPSALLPSRRDVR
jgi:hypothetical protein